MQAPDHSAGFHLEGREERRGAVADVVMGVALGMTGRHRKKGLRAIESLDLRLLVHAEHHGPLGRIQVEPDDVAYLFDEERVVGELEGAGSMRLECEGVPDPADGGRAHPGRLGHGSGAPVRGSAGRGLERLGDDALDLGIGDLARGPRPRFVGEAVESVLKEARPPLADGDARDMKVLGDRGVGLSLVGEEHDPGAGRETLGGLAASRPVLEHLVLFSSEFERFERASARHRDLLHTGERPRSSICSVISGAGH